MRNIMLRTNTCGELTAKDKTKKITLCGWVHRRRDHGGIIFVDLRDRYGLTQVKFDPAVDKKMHAEAEKIRSEWVLCVEGEVIPRPSDMINKKMATGEIEIKVEKLTIINESKTPPFEIDEEKAKESNEALRLKYRFVDLRRNKLQNIMAKRDELIKYVRAYFHKNDFVEVHTPILANSSPEGARDFLVPSRMHPGKFYALPQAPQQFKQLLMIGGLDRYFQIAPCFRDEDPRSDRHPGDFYQIDMEMSFVDQEDVWDLNEKLMVELTEKFCDKKILNTPFPRIPYHEAMTKYGSDKPDLRFDMEIQPISDLVKDCGFGVFAEAVKAGGVVHALRVEKGAEFTRKIIDDLTDLAKQKGAKGLAYIQVKEDKLQSPIIKFLGEELAGQIVKEVGAQKGDLIFFAADKWRVACECLGAVRSECGNLLELKDPKKIAWAWIVDFPMYDYSEIEEGRIDFSHNPFSMPQGGLRALEEEDPLEIKAYQYDLVCNGYEISSGAIRNHDPEIMYKAFEIAGYTKKQVDEQFGAMIEAFKYGAPPHGGMAPGLDRLLMIFFDLENIRDIYAFPKDGQGRDLMMGSPAEVDPKQLDDLQIKVTGKK